MEITDEMREAVYKEWCERDGHPFDISQAITSGDQGQLPTDVRDPDPDTLPHLICRRCGIVYIVAPDRGESYDDAETKLLGRLKAADTLAKNIKEKADRRKNKDTA